MKVGLVGFGGSGKSTLFDALAGGKGAEIAGAGRVATVTLDADERFLALAAMYEPKKRTPASFTVHDYPGLAVPGADGGAKISVWRDEVEALVLVVRGFATDDYFYPRPAADPARDAADLVAELVLEDLDVLTRRVEKLRISSEKPTPKQDEEKRELALLERVRAGLEDERPVKEMHLTPDEARALKGYSLLTAKPWTLLVSLADDGEPGGSELGIGKPGIGKPGIGGPFEARFEIRVRLEAELLELPEEERGEFMEDMGVSELRLPRFLDGLYDATGMIRFYTVGPKEVHAWEIPAGTNARDAAGEIHTDLARGFIRAEVTPWSELLDAGSEREAKARGATRLEGKEYVVKDGDVMLIRFNV